MTLHNVELSADCCRNPIELGWKGRCPIDKLFAVVQSTILRRGRQRYSVTVE
jgi:hypothetical protein